jgi:hypothetical protein
VEYIVNIMTESAPFSYNAFANQSIEEVNAMLSLIEQDMADVRKIIGVGIDFENSSKEIENLLRNDNAILQVILSVF